MEKSKVIAMLQVNAIQSVKYHQPQYDNDVLFESYSEVKIILKNMYDDNTTALTNFNLK